MIQSRIDIGSISAKLEMQGDITLIKKCRKQLILSFLKLSEFNFDRFVFLFLKLYPNYCSNKLERIKNKSKFIKYELNLFLKMNLALF